MREDRLESTREDRRYPDHGPAHRFNLRGGWKRLVQEIRQVTRPDWSLEEVGRHWDETTHYDDINAEAYSYYRRFTDAYALCDIPHPLHVMDICCRTGNGTAYFARKGKIRKATCVDVSDYLLSLCADLLKEEGVPFETRKIDGYDLPFSDGSFEGVLCFETAEHIAKPDVFIRELGRVTQRGGLLVLTTPNVLWEPVHWFAAVTELHHSEGPHRFIPLRRLRRYVEAAGFRIVTERTTVLIPAGPPWLVRFGEFLERLGQGTYMRLLGLRRILICRKA